MLTGKEMLAALSGIDEKYIAEAAEPQPSRQWPRWIAAAAAIIVFAAVMTYPKNYPAEEAPYMEQPIKNIPEEGPTALPQDEILYVYMRDIPFNELSDVVVDRAKRYIDISWARTRTYQEVLAAYTPRLGELYVPEGLYAGQSKQSLWTYYVHPDGTVIEDAVYFEFYHAYYADGSPKLTEDVAATKGFYVLASKTGIFHCCIYPEPAFAKTYTINGTAVTFGKRSLPYGPYDPDTHTPSGYYEQHTAAFTLGDADYEIVTSQLEPIEIVRIVVSLLCGEKKFVVS